MKNMGERSDVIEIPRTGEKFVFLRRPRDTQGEVFEIEFFVREFALVAARPHIHATAEERVEVIAGTARMRMGLLNGCISAGCRNGRRKRRFSAGRSSGHLRAGARDGELSRPPS